jgi:hypothetical protein
MPYQEKTFVGERARQLARSGSLSGKTTAARSWWPEDVCARIEKIVWVIYCTGETGDEWHEFTAYDKRGKILKVRRVEGF